MTLNSFSPSNALLEGQQKYKEKPPGMRGCLPGGWTDLGLHSIP